MARVLSAALPQELLGKLKLPENYREISQRDISRNKRGLGEFLPKETSSIMLKLSFLTLVKTSNALYTPKKAESVGGLAIHKTRYSVEAMTAIFKSQVLPVHIGPARGHIRKVTVLKNRGIGLKMAAIGIR